MSQWTIALKQKRKALASYCNLFDMVISIEKGDLQTMELCRSISQFFKKVEHSLRKLAQRIHGDAMLEEIYVMFSGTEIQYSVR